MADDAAHGENNPDPSDAAKPSSGEGLAASPSAIPGTGVATAPQPDEAHAPQQAAGDAPAEDDLAVPDADVAAPPDLREFPRKRPALPRQAGGLYLSSQSRTSWSPARRALLLSVALLVPCGVIALSLYFIVKAGPPAALLAAAGAPQLSPGESATAPSREPEEQPSAASPGSIASSSPSLENSVLNVPGFEDEGNDEEPAPSKPAPPKHFATVQDAALGSCSTESVDGLSRQIIEQARCIKPNDFVALPKRPNLVMAPHVFPYLELGARDHLLKALDAHTNQTMTINSALRTVAQQYLVSHWAATKICGVQLATSPGESNHEIGSALDIAEAAKWRPALETQQFRWLGASDRVHFDYKGGSPAPRSATDVLAFQRLWNRNHPEDAIVETGQYGPPTEQRLKKSPPTGFALGASCRPNVRKR